MKDKLNGKASNLFGWFTTIAMTIAAVTLLWTVRFGQ